MSYSYLWQFEIVPEKRKEFEEVYGTNGAWVRMFQTDSNYIGTELIRDIHTSNRYVTIDTWKSREAWIKFRELNGEKFEALDKECESLTLYETKIGEFEIVE